MKNFKSIAILIIFTSSLFLVQCETEPIPGPPGQAGINGIDGKDGVDGLDGIDGGTTCISCHSESHREPIKSSYAYSGHAAAGAVGYAGSRGSCARCHSNEGFIDYITYGKANPDGYDNPTRIDCNTCHDKHETFDFENDGYDYALRTFAPVTLITDESYTINLGDKSNTCVNCHQPRRTPPTPDEEGMFAVTSSHWGPHHGPQSTLLEGIQGALIAGSEDYPDVGSATHRTGSSCVKCHMGEDSGSVDGQHSMKPTSTACTDCHSNGVPSEVEGLAENMVTLANLLDEVGIVHEGHPVEGEYSIVQAEAAWNYLLVMEDASNGVHNPKYVNALIKNSIEVLE